MTNKEILAELKKSYEYLSDIRYNGCADHFGGQLNHELIDMLEVAKTNIENIYFKFYKTLNKETLRVKSLESNKNKVYISNDVSTDYETEDEPFTCEDVNYFWYDDQKFLNNSKLDYKYDNKYYAKIWITEFDRNQGYSEEYPQFFDSLSTAIKTLREYFYKGNCACIEIYDSNNELNYICDKESEDFYIKNKKVSKIPKKIIENYVDSWINNKTLPVKDTFLYCENDNNSFTAIDNSLGECYTEDFDSEEKVFKWLLNEYEIGDENGEEHRMA